MSIPIMQIKYDWDGPEFSPEGWPIDRWYPYKADGSPSGLPDWARILNPVIRRSDLDAEMDRYFTDPPAKEEGVW